MQAMTYCFYFLFRNIVKNRDLIFKNMLPQEVSALHVLHAVCERFLANINAECFAAKMRKLT
jgi:hypothetical protein